jgi:Na+-translocating ferredoxin:NAD+ oxidoreductase RnfD subunit
VNISAPFDLYSLLVQQIAGSSTVFIFMSFAVVTLMCAMFRLPSYVTLLILIFYGILISAFFSTLLPIILVIVGFFFALALGKLISAR